MTSIVESNGTTPISGEFRASRLTKHYGGVTALDAVDVFVQRGEIVAIVGDNGAGKSTLVACMAGTIQPDSGVITIDGHEHRFNHPRDARAAGVETVYQNLGLAEDLDVVGNLFMGRELTYRFGVIRLLNERKMRVQAEEILRDYGIRLKSVRTLVRNLSGGQRQGVAIGRAVAWGTKYVILDEPTAALGVRERSEVARVLEGLRARGLGVMLVSHNLEEVFRVADRLYVFRHGAVVRTARVAETSRTEVVAFITGAVEATRGAGG